MTTPEPPPTPSSGPVPAPESGSGPAPGAASGHVGGPAEPDGPRSGLRNPGAAVRGVGAGTLAMEAVVLLLAIAPLVKLSVRMTGLAVAAMIILAVACLVLAGLMRHRWAWYAGTALQIVLAICGVFHLALLALGILFGAVWAYALSVRRTVLGRI
jgi:hypothetical protein